MTELVERVRIRPEAPPQAAGWERALELDTDALRAARAALKRELAAELGLDPDLLTIGFARRFAAYKRAGLAFTDPARLARLPVQLVIAGKAHPADEEGKQVLASVLASAGEPALRGRVAFVEDYDLSRARRLVAGVDVWMNTPLRPLEASGTSGMKAGLNGVLNLSVLDGWWAEGWDPSLGWAIDGDDEAEAGADAEALYRLLEDEVVPLWRDGQDDWLAMVRASIAGVGARFTTARMVDEYLERFYVPAHQAAALAARS
jgi:starch phosphorylase